MTEHGNPVRYYITPSGYEKCTNSYNGAEYSVRVNHLVAIANGTDPQIVFDHNHVVVPKNGVPWDNRHDNIEVVHRREIMDHARSHTSPKYNVDELLMWIDSFVETFGVVPTEGDIRDWPGPSPGPYYKLWESFTNAIRAAGYTPRSEREPRDTDDTPRNTS